VEHTHFAEEDHRHPTTFALTDLGTELNKQRLDVTPLNIGTHRASVNGFDGFLVLPLHGWNGTNFRYQVKHSGFCGERRGTSVSSG